MPRMKAYWEVTDAHLFYESPLAYLIGIEGGKADDVDREEGRATWVPKSQTEDVRIEGDRFSGYVTKWVWDQNNLQDGPLHEAVVTGEEEFEWEQR